MLGVTRLCAARIVAGCYRPIAVAIVGIGLGACLDRAEDCAKVNAVAGETFTCTMPGYVDRAFDVRVPASWTGAPLRVIVALHGGGAFKGAADSVSCPGGEASDPHCIGNIASARGYALVMPNGIGSRPLRGVRTWNAGGGVNGYTCGFGAACGLDVDDVSYIEAMFGQLEAALPIDTAHVYATGISNGGAMTHRLGCEDRTRFAAIVPVSGTNLHADSGGRCAVTIPILDIHGSGDPVWPYAGGDLTGGYVSGADETMENWRVRNGCAATYTDEALPDVDPGDDTTVTRRRWDACAQDTERIVITNGGHTWPSGNQYLTEAQIGRVTFDFGSDSIVDFFDAH